jgi:RHH-type rel operon transcriptional repressor/antitoxin RelB
VEEIMAVLTLRLDDQLEKKLKQLSKETERPKSYFVKKALALYLDEYRDYETALARRADKDEEILTLAQMKKTLGV